MRWTVIFLLIEEFLGIYLRDTEDVGLDYEVS